MQPYQSGMPAHGQTLQTAFATRDPRERERQAIGSRNLSASQPVSQTAVIVTTTTVTTQAAAAPAFRNSYAAPYSPYQQAPQQSSVQVYPQGLDSQQGVSARAVSAYVLPNNDGSRTVYQAQPPEQRINRR